MCYVCTSSDTETVHKRSVSDRLRTCECHRVAQCTAACPHAMRVAQVECDCCSPSRVHAACAAHRTRMASAVRVRTDQKATELHCRGETLCWCRVGVRPCVQQQQWRCSCGPRLETSLGGRPAREAEQHAKRGRTERSQNASQSRGRHEQKEGINDAGCVEAGFTYDKLTLLCSWPVVP